LAFPFHTNLASGTGTAGNIAGISSKIANGVYSRIVDDKIGRVDIRRSFVTGHCDI